MFTAAPNLPRHVNPVKLFSGDASRYLSEEIADYYGAPLGDVTVRRFSDGEMRVIINESVRGSYVFFIQSTFSPSDNLLELLLMMDAAKRASAEYITAVIPYFGYARQDRKDKPRVPISARLMADILQTAGADRVMTLDFHADQIQGFFNIPVDHLKSDAIFIPHLQANVDLDNVTFASPDVGGVKRARTYSKFFHRELVICDKVRSKVNEVSEMTVIGEVTGADVIVVDDLVDTAGTLCRAAEVLMAEGARSVRALCTHPVLSGDAYEKIAASKFTEIIVCDTIPLKAGKPREKITVLSTDRLFARAIRNTHEHKSISALFVGG